MGDVPVNFYGCEKLFHPSTEQSVVDLKCFRWQVDSVNGHKGLLPAHEHLERYIRLNWESDVVCFEKEVGGVTYKNNFLTEVLKECCYERELVLTGSASSGKCLAPGTMVMRFDGTLCRADEVEKGMLLMGDDSTPRTVLGSNPGRSNMVKIKPIHSDPWECNDDHILTLKRTWAGKRSQGRVGDVVDISVKDYLASSASFKRQHKLFIAPVEFRHKPVPVDPRIYGLWLGDGTTTRAEITCHESEAEVLGYWVDHFVSRGYSISALDSSGTRCPTYRVVATGAPYGKLHNGQPRNPFLEFIRRSSGMKNKTDRGRKRILAEYLYNSREVRLQLLAGIIDTDGHANDTYFEVVTCSSGLKNDIVYIARSLGFMTSAVLKKDVNAWRINIMGDNLSEIPTLKKRVNPRKLRFNADCEGFEIEQLGVGDWYGFALSGNHRFLLGDCTVTHNTFPAALYCLSSFYSAPNSTTVLTSTTSASGADGRIWSAIKALHNDAKFKVGSPIDYIKSIVFEPGKELEGKKDVGQRDVRDALLVVPIGRGAEGRAATRAIIGRKNTHIIWVVDELPEMDEGILEDTMANLENNPFFQFIGLGNAASRIDPHGLMCEPENGWGSEDAAGKPYGGKWKTKSGGTCIFLDGHKSPNMHNELLEIDNKAELPFPYLANHIGHNRNAARYGHGDPDVGRKTLPYLRMSRGIWPDSDVEQTILSRSLIKKLEASERPIFDTASVVTLCGCDPAFTAGGDQFVLQFGDLGTTWDGVRRLVLDDHPTVIHPVAGVEYTEGVAKQVVDACVARGVLPGGFGLDVSSDGGVIGQAIQRAWGTHDIHMISSMGKPTERVVSSEDPRSCIDAYDRAVTEYWFSVRVAALTGHLKGFNIHSEYARDLFSRLYIATGNDKVAVETKKDMKKRIKHSPDCGDATSYLVEVARRNGLEFLGGKLPEPVEVMDPYQKIAANSGYDGFADEQEGGTWDAEAYDDDF